MIKDIIKDQFILSQKSCDATIEDKDVINDLKETFAFHQEHCIGMAANMIGVLKNIIIVQDGTSVLVLINPVILKTSSHFYEADEGCLCHKGTKLVKRFDQVKVSYLDENFKKKIKTFHGLTAQIIQHEIDHCHGVLI